MLDINPGLIVYTIITFILLLFILRKFAWSAIVGALETREQGIRAALDSAEQARAEAQRILEENRKQLGKAEDEARRILNENRALAEKLKSEIVDQANQQSRKMLDQARQEIERGKDAALQQLRGEVANLAVIAAGKIINETLDVQKHQKLIDETLRTLPRTKN